MKLTGFVGPTYTLRAVNVDAQRCVNLYPEQDEIGTGKEREIASLVSTPGLILFCAGDGFPSRGSWLTSDSRAFQVEGRTLYELSSGGTKTSRGTLTSSATTGYISMADNGVQLMLVDGDSGYILTLATNVFTEITDTDFPTATFVTFLNGYFIVNSVGTRQFFYSSLYDGATWDALDFGSKEGQPDNLKCVLAVNGDLVLLGDLSTEFFYDTGDADTPFLRRPGALIERGIAAPATAKKLDNSFYFVGVERNGNKVVWRLQGYNPVRVSNYAVEQAISSYGDISTGTAFTYQEGGHSFYCLNLPGADTTWCLDVATGLWHERTYTNAGELERHRAENHIYAFGKHLVGDYANGNVYELNEEAVTDNTAVITRLRRCPHISAEGKRMRMDRLQLDCQTGVGLDASLTVQREAPAYQGDVGYALNDIVFDGAHFQQMTTDWDYSGYLSVAGDPPTWETVVGNITFQQVTGVWPTALHRVDDLILVQWVRISDTVPREPQVMLSFSDDGGYTYSNEQIRGLGLVGEYNKRVIWNRQGIFRDRVFEIKITDPLRVTLIALSADVKQLRN